MAHRLTRSVYLALGLTAVAAGAWAASSPTLTMRFAVTGMRLVLPTLPEAGARPPAQFYARSATGTMAQELVVYASDVTGNAKVQLQANLAAQDSTLSSPSAILGQPAGTLVFPAGLRVQWSSGELTAASARVEGSRIELAAPRIASDRWRLRADHAVMHVRAAQDVTSAPAGALDASFSTDVQVVLR